MEQYQGIKFDVRFIADEIPQFEEIEELVTWGKKLSDFECIATYSAPDNENCLCSAGNLSVRKEDHFIITSAGSNLGKLTKDDFVEVVNVDLTTKLIAVKGTTEPSSETMLHNEIYQKRDDIKVIFHGHNDCILEFAKKLGIRSTIEQYPYGTVDLMESVIQVLDDEISFLIMKGHGFLSFGKTCQQAGEQIINVLKEIHEVRGD